MKVKIVKSFDEIFIRKDSKRIKKKFQCSWICYWKPSVNRFAFRYVNENNVGYTFNEETILQYEFNVKWAKRISNTWNESIPDFYRLDYFRY